MGVEKEAVEEQEQQEEQEVANREDPRFFVTREGCRYCILCGQWSDDGHLWSKRHTKRCKEPEWYLSAGGYLDSRYSQAQVDNREVPRPRLQSGALHVLQTTLFGAVDMAGEARWT
mmetsp:Transcript_85812/g.223160  ORF Transcript_85812/g.223160 Transcript_85812/m.223160 type:complete len:116 (+) Transcript_85812:2231-2578(+)